MPSTPNALRWDGGPGHYEVYYLTLTDPPSGVGVWVRYTMTAPLADAGEPPSASLWFVVTDPRPGRPPVLARKATVAIDRLDGRDFASISPVRVLRNWSSYALTGWRFEAADRTRKVIVEVDADRERLAGVTYRDPDGESAYCYNTETASMRLHLYERAPRVGGWAHASTLHSRGGAHFEYAQRTPVPDQELHLR